MKDKKNKILHRIKIIKGHISGIERMVENDSYCIDVIHQSQAVQKALKQLDKAIIEDHIKCCVIDQAKQGNSDKITDDLLRIFEYK